MNEFKALITEKNLSNAQVAKIVQKSTRSVQRWSAGTANQVMQNYK